MPKFQTFSVSTSFRRGWRMVRAGGVAGRPADMAKSSEWRTDFGRFWLRRGTGFAGLDVCKDCAMLGTETGGSESKARRFPVRLCQTIDTAGCHGAFGERDRLGRRAVRLAPPFPVLHHKRVAQGLFTRARVRLDRRQRCVWRDANHIFRDERAPLKSCSTENSEEPFLVGSAYGNRTRLSALRGPCPNR